jgi:cytochrome c oxidase assembly protein subunit 15
VGSVAGLLTAALTLWLWLVESRRWVRWLAVVAFGLVSLQGVLGGLRVVWLNQTLAAVHASVAPMFFAVTVALALVTSRGWTTADLTSRRAPDRVLPLLATVITGVLYLQIVLGAFAVHLGHRLDAHLVAAIALSVLIPVLATRVRSRHAGEPSLGRSVIRLGSVLALQLLLGLGAYAARVTGGELPLHEVSGFAVPVVHRITGAVLLAMSLVFTLQVCRRSNGATAGARLTDSLMPKRVVA